MQKTGISRKETLYVGDMAIDVRTGRRAKVKTFAVTTGSSTLAELKKEKPDFISRDLSKLFKDGQFNQEEGKVFSKIIKLKKFSKKDFYKFLDKSDILSTSEIMYNLFLILSADYAKSDEKNIYFWLSKYLHRYEVKKKIQILNRAGKRPFKPGIL